MMRMVMIGRDDDGRDGGDGAGEDGDDEYYDIAPFLAFTSGTKL